MCVPLMCAMLGNADLVLINWTVIVDMEHQRHGRRVLGSAGSNPVFSRLHACQAGFLPPANSTLQTICWLWDQFKTLKVSCTGQMKLSYCEYEVPVTAVTPHQPPPKANTTHAMSVQAQLSTCVAL